MQQKNPEINNPEANEKGWVDIYCDQIKNNIERSVTFSYLSEDQKNLVIKKAVEAVFGETNQENNHTDKNQKDTINVYGGIRKYIYMIEPWLRENFNSDDQEDAGILGPKMQEANKLFTATLIDCVNEEQKEDGEPAAIKLAINIYKQFFSYSPNINSYIGGISGSIELLSLASRRSVSRRFFSAPIDGEVVYNYSFAPNQDNLMDPFSGKDPIEQVHLLEVELLLAKEACGNDFSIPFVNKVRQVFTNIIDNPDTLPLLRHVAQDKLEQINNHLNITTGSSYGFGSHRNYVDLSRRKTEERHRLIDEQSTLHDEFSGFAPEDYLIRMSPEVCASKISGQFDSIVSLDGQKASIADWQPNNEFGISEDDMFLLRVAHEPGTRSRIEAELGINLVEIPLDTQIYLLRFAMEAGNHRYNKLVKGLNSFQNKSDKMQLIEAFLSLEFGEDFGDDVLSIAEHAKPDESVEVFKIINEYRGVSKRFGQIYCDFSPDFAHATEKAMNERLSDLLVTIEHVAKNGRTKMDVSPAKNKDGYVNDGHFDITIESVAEAIDVMRQFLKAQQILQDVLADDNTRITKMSVENSDQLGSQTYNLINSEKGFVQLHTRERGSSKYDKSIEYGNSSGTEATISWLVNPSNPYKKPSAKDPDAISTRFDREGRLVDEAPDSTDRSPIREQGIISIDIGSVIGDDSSRLSVRLGRMIAAGNGLRAERQGTDSSLNHNTNYFDQTYGSADNFEKLVEYIESKVEKGYKAIVKTQLARIAINLRAKSDEVAKSASAGDRLAS